MLERSSVEVKVLLPYDFAWNVILLLKKKFALAKNDNWMIMSLDFSFGYQIKIRCMLYVVKNLWLVVTFSRNHQAKNDNWIIMSQDLSLGYQIKIRCLLNKLDVAAKQSSICFSRFRLDNHYDWLSLWKLNRAYL